MERPAREARARRRRRTAARAAARRVARRASSPAGEAKSPVAGLATPASSGKPRQVARGCPGGMSVPACLLNGQQTQGTEKMAFNEYRFDLGRCVPMEREKELRCANEYVRTRDPRLAERLVRANLRLVVKIAKKY